MDQPAASGVAASGAVAEPPTWVPGESPTARVEVAGSAGVASAGVRDEADISPVDFGLGDPNERKTPANGDVSSTSRGSVARDSTREIKPPRTYVVFEELDLADLVAGVEMKLGESGAPVVDRLLQATGKIFRVVDEAQSSNATHALRKVAKAHFAGGTTPTLVAVPLRNWRPLPVPVISDTRVSI